MFKVVPFILHYTCIPQLTPMLQSVTNILYYSGIGLKISEGAASRIVPLCGIAPLHNVHVLHNLLVLINLSV